MQNPLIRLFKEFKPYIQSSLIIFFSGVVLSLISAQFAVLLKKLMDSLESASDQSNLLQNAGIILSFSILAAITRYIHLFVTDITIEKIVQSLRSQLQSKLLELPPAFHLGQNQGTGHMISRIINDMLIIQNGLRYMIDLLREPILLVALLGWLFYLNWSLTLSIFIILPLLLKLLKKLSLSVAKYARQGQEQMEKITQFIKENLDGIRMIQSYTLEEYSKNKLKNIFDTYYEIRKTMHSRVEIASPLSELVATFVGIGVVVSIAFSIQKGQATYGDFTSYLAALLMLNRPLKVIQESVVRLQEVLVATQRLYTIIDTPSTLTQSAQALPFPKNFSQLSFKNIQFSYHDRPILNNISFSVKKGQTVAFVGPSGGGKSTLINMLPRFFDPQSGQIYFDDILLTDIDLKSLRQNIALVNQDVFLFSDSLEENIWLGNTQRPINEVPQAAAQASAHEFILKQSQGYQALVGEKGQLFSGGEKQRISLARALFKKAPLLILDEATSNLDAQSEALVQAAFDLIKSEHTCLVVAHRLSTVINADWIFVLQEGNIVAQGRHEDLIKDTQGLYFELAHQQNLV